MNDDPLDPPPGATAGPAAGPRVVEEAPHRRWGVALDHQDSHGARTRRRVEPMIMAAPERDLSAIGEFPPTARPVDP